MRRKLQTKVGAAIYSKRKTVVDVGAGEVKVMSGVVNGKRGEPKTKARKASLPLIPPVLSMLDLYRLRLGNPTSGIMFPTEVGHPCVFGVR